MIICIGGDGTLLYTSSMFQVCSEAVIVDHCNYIVMFRILRNNAYFLCFGISSCHMKESLI